MDVAGVLGVDAAIASTTREGDGDGDDFDISAEERHERGFNYPVRPAVHPGAGIVVFPTKGSPTRVTVMKYEPASLHVCAACSPFAPFVHDEQRMSTEAILTDHAAVSTVRDELAAMLTLTGHIYPVTSVAVGGVGSKCTHVLTASSDTVLLWSLEDRHCVRVIEQPPQFITHSLFNAVTTHVVAACGSSVFVVAVSGADGKAADEESTVTAVLEGHEGNVTAIAFADRQNHSVLITADDAKMFKIWDVEQKALLYQSQIEARAPFSSILYHAPLQKLFLGTDDGMVHVCQCKIHQHAGTSTTVISQAPSPPRMEISDIGRVDCVHFAQKDLQAKSAKRTAKQGPAFVRVSSKPRWKQPQEDAADTAQDELIDDAAECWAGTVDSTIAWGVRGMAALPSFNPSTEAPLQATSELATVGSQSALAQWYDSAEVSSSPLSGEHTTGDGMGPSSVPSLSAPMMLDRPEELAIVLAGGVLVLDCHTLKPCAVQRWDCEVDWPLPMSSPLGQRTATPSLLSFLGKGYARSCLAPCVTAYSHSQPSTSPHQKGCPQCGRGVCVYAVTDAWQNVNLLTLSAHSQPHSSGAHDDGRSSMSVKTSSPHATSSALNRAQESNGDPPARSVGLTATNSAAPVSTHTSREASLLVQAQANLSVIASDPLLPSSPLSASFQPKKPDKEASNPRRAKSKAMKGSGRKGTVLKDQALTFRSKIKSSGYTSAPRGKMFVPVTETSGRLAPIDSTSSTASKGNPKRRASSAKNLTGQAPIGTEPDYPFDAPVPTELAAVKVLNEAAQDCGVLAFSMSPDGSRFVTRMADKTVQNISTKLSSQTPGRIGKTHRNYVSSASFSLDGRWIISTGETEKIIIWHAQKMEPLVAFKNVEHNFSRKGDARKSSASSTSGSRETSASRKPPSEHAARSKGSRSSKAGAIQTSDNMPFTKLTQAQFFYRDKFVLAAHGSDLLLYKYHLDPKVDEIKRYINKSKYKLAASVHIDSSLACICAVNTFYSHLVLGAAQNRGLYVFDMNRATVVAQYKKAHARPVYAIAMHTEASSITLPPETFNLFASASLGDGISLWDVRSDRAIRSFTQHTARAFPVGCAFSPCGRYIACGSENKMAYVYDIRQGSLLEKIGKHKDVVTDVAFHPNRPLLYTSSMDGKMRVFKPQT